MKQHSLQRYILLGLPIVAGWWAIYLLLPAAAHWFTTGLLRLPADSALGQSVEFFVYEVPKVLLLLTGVVFTVGVIRSFFTPQRTRQLLAGRRESVGNVLGAMLGVVTPFCSCSAVPLFIGFVTAGVPLGVTFSFLLAAPLINEIALVLLLDMLGWKIALLYLGTGLTISILSGWIIGRLRLEKWVEPWVYQMQMGDAAEPEPFTWAGRIRFGAEQVRDIVGRVWLYVLIGIGVGAGIHGYVPDLSPIMGKGAWWSVPAVVLIGVPLYSNAAAILPVCQALLAKGAAMGTVLAFMMSVIGLSMPEAVILRKVLTVRLIVTFFGIVAAGILVVGYLFNLVL